jgi:hypothetical protein
MVPVYEGLLVTVGRMVSKGLRAFSYQVTAKFGAGYYAPKTTETLINYTAYCAVVLFIH